MNETSSTQISIEDLTDLGLRCLSAMGLDDDERRIVNDVLMYAQLRGNSQGYIKIVEKSVLPGPDKSEMGIEHRTKAIAHITANDNIGMVVFHRATKLAIDACSDCGLSLVTSCGSNSSSGAMGYYAEKIADAGFIGICMAGSPKVLALHGSSKPAMGTNPIAVAAPALEEPLVIDMATAAMSYFEVVRRSREGEALPPGIASGPDGLPTISAQAALKGALHTFGGAKGSALALAVEILTGPLCGAAMLGDDADGRGHFILAIDPAAVGADIGADFGAESDDKENFQQRMQTLRRRMLAQIDREDGTGHLPGMRSQAIAQAHRKAGNLLVSDRLLQQLEAIAENA